MAKKPWMLDKKELSKRQEEEVAKVLGGKVQVGSGSVRVAFLRADVIASPFMIECKATAKQTIDLKYDVWEDLKNKTKQTTYKPAYVLGVTDTYGNYYDVIGVDIRNLTDPLLKKMCPNGMLQHYDIKKTKIIAYIETLVKQNKYLSVYFEESGETLFFIPLKNFANHFDELIEGGII